MLFWAIADKFKVDHYYDFESKQSEEYLEHTRLLPTEEMAKTFIQEHLTDSEGTESGYQEVEIHLEEIVIKDGELSESAVVYEVPKEWEKALQRRDES